MVAIAALTSSCAPGSCVALPATLARARLACASTFKCSVHYQAHAFWIDLASACSMMETYGSAGIARSTAESLQWPMDLLHAGWYQFAAAGEYECNKGLQNISQVCCLACAPCLHGTQGACSGLHRACNQQCAWHCRRHACVCI
jgi:hypothetical protein